MPLHLIKLSVGSESVDTLRQFQADRLRTHGHVFHLTRMIPTRIDELLDGGSIYWVIKGLVSGRQRLLDIVESQDGEGRRQCRLVLDPDLIEVERRAHKPFQGWRYLKPDDAPPDRRAGDDDLPPEMAEELRRLGLL